MNVYRYNQHTMKYYKYNIRDYNTEHPMFNEELHNNDITPCTLYHNTCAYCMTIFKSRTQLFNHLGFMNINIGGRKSKNQYNAEMGDFGLGNIPDMKAKSRRYKRNKRFRYKYRRMRICKAQREKPHATLNLLMEMMDSVKLT